MTQLETIEFYIEQLFERSHKYFQERKNMPLAARSNKECNNIFKFKDVQLCDMIQSIKDLAKSGKILTFGIPLNGNYSDNSKLKRKCTSCSSCPPMTFGEKNRLRESAEKILKRWKSDAMKWLNTDPEQRDIREAQNMNINKAAAPKKKTGRIGSKFIGY